MDLSENPVKRKEHFQFSFHSLLSINQDIPNSTLFSVNTGHPKTNFA